MSTAEIVVLSDIVTLFLSLGVTLVGAGIKWGALKTEVKEMKAVIDKTATKEEVTQMKEALAEIKGMFVLRLRE